MRTLSLILVAGLLSLSAAAQNTQQRGTTNTPNAQNPQSGVWRPLMMNDSTARALNLTPEQQRGWSERGALYDRDYRGLKPGTTSYDTDRQRWWDRRDADMKKFLTPEQYTQWQRMDTRPTAGTPSAPTQPKR
jgi:hypothetical protein